MEKSQILVKGDYSFHQRNHITPARMCTGIQSRKVSWEWHESCTPDGADTAVWVLLSVSTQGIRDDENHGPIWPQALEARLGRGSVCTHQEVPHRITEHRDLEWAHKDQLLFLHRTLPGPHHEPEHSRCTSPLQYTPDIRARAQQWI